jgi:hypothetical protein
MLVLAVVGVVFAGRRQVLSIVWMPRIGVGLDVKDVDLATAKTSCSACFGSSPLVWHSTRPEATLTGYISEGQFVHMDNWFFYMQDVLIEQTGLRVRFRTDLSDQSKVYPGITLLFVEWYRIHDVCNRIANQIGLNKFIVFLSDDEGGVVSSDSFPSSVVLVLRPYYFTHIFSDPRMFFFPTGYMFGKGPRRPTILLNASQREVHCWFSGMLHAGREEMVNQVSAANTSFSCRLETSPNFNSGLTPRLFSLMMQETVFALVPGGNSPETIRMYEAWENGAIPVMVEKDVIRGHLRHTHPGFPALVLPSWEHVSELANWLKPQMAASLDELQRHNIEWYQLYKISLGQKLRQRLEKLFPEVYQYVQ